MKSTTQLNCSAGRDRARLSSQRKRKKPSLEHVRSLGNMSMIFPENMPNLRIEEEEETVQKKAMLPPHPFHPKPTQEDKTSKLPQPTPPKPKPRPQPRRKIPSPDHAVTPESVSEKSLKSPPESPMAAKKPIPVPRSGSKDHNINTSDQPPVEKITNEEATPTKETIPMDAATPSSPKSSPKQSPHLHPRPVAVKPVRTSTHEDIDGSTNHVPPPMKKPKPAPPKPTSRSAVGAESTEDLLDIIKRKDPAELTVKEKMMLAQQAMSKQAEYKAKGLPPPIRKIRPLPKSSSVDVQDSPNREMKRESKVKEEGELEGSMERSKSMEDLLEGSPKRQPRKLPPGAFNIAIPVGLPGELRHRSYTVASGSSETHEDTQPEPDSKNETDFEETDAPDDSKTPQEDTPLHEKDSFSSTPESSHKNMSTSVSLDNLSGEEELSEDDLDGVMDQAEMLRGASNVVLAQPDVEKVLYWTPELVGIWLGNIGLGVRASSFREKSIKGHMIFDLDNAKLKVS